MRRPRWTAWALAAEAAAFAFLSLPKRPLVWTMFARVEPLRYELLDASGRALDARDFATRSRYLNEPEDLEGLAAFVCRSRPALAPLKLTTARGTLLYSAPDCHGQGGR